MHSITLLDYLKVIRRRWLLFLNFFLASVTITLIINAVQKPVYRSSVEVLLERNYPEVSIAQGSNQPLYFDETFFQTQFRLVRSVPVAERALAMLYPDLPEESRSRERGKVQGSLMTQPVGGTRMFNIVCLGDNPVWTANVANAVAQAYVEQNMEAQLKASSDAFLYITRRVGEIRGELESGQRTLTGAAQKAGYYAGQESGAGNLESSKLTSFNSRYLDAHAERIGLESNQKEFQRLYNEGKYQELAEVSDDNIVTGLSTSLREAEFSLDALRKQYREKHPEVQSQLARVNNLRQKLQEEGKKSLDRTRAKVDTLRSREESLTSSLNEIKGEIADKNRDATRYVMLSQQVSSNQELYNLLLKKMQEVNISGVGNNLTIRILTPASPPSAPIKPRKRYNIMLGLVFGLMLGITICFMDEYLDTTVKSVADVEKFLQLPVLGKIPFTTHGKLTPAEMFVNTKENFSFLENFRVLRTNIQFSSIDKPVRTLLVTSAVEKEGKTTVTTHLAASFAMLGRSVLILDCDFRRPSVHRVFDLDKRQGLTNVLLGDITIEQAIQKTNVENLSIMAAGPIPPNPAELLHSQRMDEVLNKLRDSFSLIILDSPPVVSVSDAAILGTKSDATLLVISVGKVPRELYVEAKQALAKTQTRMLGTIMNSVTAEATEYYYYQRYYHHYYRYAYQAPRDD